MSLAPSGDRGAATSIRPSHRRLLALTLAAAALTAAVVWLAWSRAAPPARCAAGMIALGPRCCGEGQHIEGADRCVGPPRACAVGMRVTAHGCVGDAHRVPIAGGVLRVGTGDWEAQGVVTPYEAALAPFTLDALEVDEERYQPCMTSGACAQLPLSGEPGRAVAGLTLAEADAFCRWAQGSLPTRDQLAYAAAGQTGRRYAWGDTGAVCRRVAWGLVDGPCGQGALGPELVGSHPDGASADGALDLAGNVAEWTAPSPPWARDAEVRGGSFADSGATALRSWQRRVIPVDTRSSEIGVRCAYPAPP